MKNQLTRFKDYVVDHQTAIFVTTLAIAMSGLVIQRTGLKQHNEFLQKHELYDTFYAIED